MEPERSESPYIESRMLASALERLANNHEDYFTDDIQRQDLLRALRKAAVKLETPFEAMQRLAYCVFPIVAARIGQDHGVFAALAEGATEKPVDIKHLSEITRLQPSFLESFMDYLCTQYMAEEVGHKQYITTELGSMMQDSLFRNAVTHFHDSCTPANVYLNTFLHQSRQLSTHNLESSPHSPPSTAYGIAFRTSRDFYSHLTRRPIQSEAFHEFMAAQFGSLPTWLSVFDVPTELGLGSSNPNHALMVDVGGGNGSQCIALRNHYPHLIGRIILQDKAEVLGDVEIDGSIEKMAYDYFTIQPVQSAHIYYLRQILHNNTYEACREILTNQAAAMSRSSVLIIDEKVLRDPDPLQLATKTVQDEYTAALSLCMKAMFNAQERREAHWRAVIAGTGLVIREIRKFTNFGDSLILCQQASKSSVSTGT